MGQHDRKNARVQLQSQSQLQWTRMLLAVTTAALAAVSQHECFFAHGWSTARPQHAHCRRTTKSSSTLLRMKEQQHRPHVVIAGGGFGGLTCQNELRTMMPSADITIVEPNERFCFRPLLYEYLGGTAELDEIAPTYNYLLSNQINEILPQKNKMPAGVSIIRGSAIQVDPVDKRLTIRCLPSGATKDLSYDALLVSAGLPPSTKAGSMPPPTAFTFATLEDAVRLKRRLGAVTKNASIVIVGGGYVGSELACTLAQIVPSSTKLTILHRDPTGVCTGAESYNREVARKRLDSLGVNVKLGTTVTSVQETTSNTDEVQYTDSNGKGSIRADILIWTISGATNKPRETTKGLPLDGRGRVVVSPTCEVQGMQKVYAIGDGAVVFSESHEKDQSLSPSPYPATAQVAMQEAAVAAYNIQLDLKGNDDRTAQKKTFHYQSLGEMLSLGGDEDASISSLNGLFKLTGPLASTTRRLVYAARMPTPKQAVRSGAEYVVGGFTRRLFDIVKTVTPE